MNDIIELNYISPISKYTFNKDANNYYLVLINSGINNKTFINKIQLLDIGNVNDQTRGYSINKAVQLQSKLQYPFYSIRLFEHNKANNNLNLLFTGEINLNNIEFNGIQITKLFAPSQVLGKLRSGKNENDTSFLSEKFFNYESIMPENKCLLFYTRLRKKNSDKVIIKPIIISNQDDNKYVYNRYHQNLIKEHHVVTIDKLCEGNTFNDYLKLIGLYDIDVNRYHDKKQDTFKSMYMRKINPQFRKLKYAPFLNNILTAAIDGRLVGISKINSATKFNIKDKQYHFKDLVTKPYQLMNGGGYLTTVLPQDYQRIHMPYAGYLTEIGIFHLDSYCITLRFESDYFMPPDVHEREYISVIYGHNIQMSRAYPELVEIQPNTSLVFYVIIFGGQESNTVHMTNGKLVNIKNIVNPNTLYKPMPKWFEKGEELATFSCTIGNILVLVNRPIEFTSDIKHYSSLQKRIASYIKMNDVVGVIL